MLDTQLLDLVSFVAGDRIFAVFAEDVESTAEARVPAALPHAPAGVLGVVCIRGRMLTVLDPISLVIGEAHRWPKSLPWVIALLGDEQLALAAQSCSDTITIAAGDIQRSVKSGVDSLPTPVLGAVRHGGEEITVLNVERLFSTIQRRRERRRRRF